MDTELWWGKRTYHLLAAAAVSQIAGDSAAIRRAQQSSARYFHRPDRKNGSNGLFSDAFEPGIEVLRGYGLYARLAKESGDWLWEGSVNLRSPGFEVNDLAFMTRADYVWMHGNLLRQWTRPTKYFRRLLFIGGGQQQFNYDGDVTDRQFQVFGQAQLPNYWNLSSFVIRQQGTLDDRLTRGGPVVRRDGTTTLYASVSTDSRRTVSVGTNPRYGRNDAGPTSWSANLDVNVRPASSVSIAAGPAYSLSRSPYQYVTDVDDATATAFYGRRYVFSDLEQRTLSMNTRLNVTFTPTLSFELFAQPFVSSARFTNFKEFAAPRQRDRVEYGRDAGTIAETGAESEPTYTVDPDGAGPASAFTFDNPNFNFRSLRGNAVLRWEYRPGSTLFVVWTQDRSDRQKVGDFRFGRDSDALFDAAPNNIFLVKINYWLGF
jgi:hypothetical protein